MKERKEEEKRKNRVIAKQNQKYQIGKKFTNIAKYIASLQN